jgi:hypothetical protein
LFNFISLLNQVKKTTTSSALPGLSLSFLGSRRLFFIVTPVVSLPCTASFHGNFLLNKSKLLSPSRFSKTKIVKDFKGNEA